MSAKGEWLHHTITKKFLADLALAGANLERRRETACRDGSLDRVRSTQAMLDLLTTIHGMLVVDEEDTDGEE